MSDVTHSSQQMTPICANDSQHIYLQFFLGEENLSLCTQSKVNQETGMVGLILYALMLMVFTRETQDI